jgi:hypothetical protein
MSAYRADNPSWAGRAWPHYFSTYCIHDRHADCRKTCKVCAAPCLCDCHGAIDADVAEELTS